MDTLGALASRRRVDLDVAVERSLRVLEPEVTLAAAEEREEDLTEVLAHLRERGQKELARRRVDFADRLVIPAAGPSNKRADHASQFAISTAPPQMRCQNATGRICRLDRMTTSLNRPCQRTAGAAL